MLDALYTHLPDHFGVRLTVSFVVIVLTILSVGWLFPSVVYGGFWLKARIQGAPVHSLHTSKGYYLLLLMCRALVLLFGVIIAAEFMGIQDNTVWTLTVSLLGFSLSFSFRDTLTHVVAGLALMLQSQPTLGEELCILQYGNEVRGSLKHIGMFNCVLEACVDGKCVTYFVPNATVVSSVSAIAGGAPLPTSTRSSSIYECQRKESKDVSPPFF